MTNRLQPLGTWALVEFFNYECSACRMREPELAEFANSKKTSVVLIRRYANFKQHALSTRSARLAELARLRGQYDEIHAYLFSQRNLTEDMLNKCEKRLGDVPTVSEKRGIDRVLGEDAVVRAKYRIDSIPSMYLVSPAGEVSHVRDLTEAAKLIGD